MEYEAAPKQYKEIAMAVRSRRNSEPVKEKDMKMERKEKMKNLQDRKLNEDCEEVRKSASGSESGSGSGSGSDSSNIKDVQKNEDDHHQSSEEEFPPNLELRSDFNPLANFTESAKTDDQGTAKIPISIPDNLTRYRIWAVAVGSEDPSIFGLGESLITAQLPLNVRCTPPRFLNYGDKCCLPIIIQNLRDIKIEIMCVSGKYGDAQEVKIPVYSPKTSQSFSTYGTLDENTTVNIQEIKIPNGILQFGELSIQLCSTQLQSLSDALLYLYQFSVESVEAISAKCLALVATNDIVESFAEKKVALWGLWKKESSVQQELRNLISKDMKKLKERQRKNGSFGLFSHAPDPFVSCQVAHCVSLCKEKGYNIGEGFLGIKSWVSDLSNYLTDLYTNERHPDYYVKDYDLEQKNTIKAYALYANHKLTRDPKVRKQAEEWIKQTSKTTLNFEALGLLLTVFSEGSGEKSTYTQEILRHLSMESVIISEEDQEVHMCKYPYKKNGIPTAYNSNPRCDAIILEAFLNADPTNYHIPGLVRNLLKQRGSNGAWENTQINSWAIVAIDKYFRVFEKDEPNLTTHFWIENDYCGSEKFKGRTVEQRITEIGIKYLLKDGETKDEESLANKELMIWREGKGRVYYRLSLTVCPEDFSIPALNRGFDVSRVFSPSKSGKEHIEDVVFHEGIWRVKKSSLVQVDITVKVEFAVNNVAIVDNLPAGFEVVNEKLKGTTEDEDKKVEQSSTWYNHKNIRDDRVEVFADSLKIHSYHFSYVARATTIGQFITPPTRAEELYTPQIFGYCSSTVVVVE